MIVAKRIIRTGLAVSEDLKRAAIHGMAVEAAFHLIESGGCASTKQMMGIDGVRKAAEELWPDLAEEYVLFHRSRWTYNVPRPLMTTTGYALSWYP